MIEYLTEAVHVFSGFTKLMKVLKEKDWAYRKPNGLIHDILNSIVED